jgi:prolyl-tRNA synthetase
LKRAKAYRDAGLQTADNYAEFQEKIEAGGFVAAHWDGTRETEDKVQSETKATIRCIPDASNGLEIAAGNCMVTGKPSKQRVLFARAY